MSITKTNLKKTLQGASPLWLGTLAGSGSTFILQILLSRTLSPNDYGEIAYAISLSTALSLLAGFGAPQVLLKIYGSDINADKNWIPKLAVITLLASTLAVALMFIWQELSITSSTAETALSLFSFYILGQALWELAGARLQTRSQYIRYGIWLATPASLRLAMATIIILLQEVLQITEVALIYATIALLISILSSVLLREKTKTCFENEPKAANRWARQDFKKALSMCLPYASASIFAYIYTQSSILFISFSSTNEEVAKFNISFLIVSAITLLPAVLYQKLLTSKFHKWAASDLPMLKKAYLSGNVLMALTGSVFSLFVILSDDWIISTLFGSIYLDSTQTLKILSISLPLYFLAYSSGTVLLTGNHITTKIKLMGTVAAVSLILNYLFVPAYGSEGAALIIVTCNLLQAFLYMSATKKLVFKG